MFTFILDAMIFDPETSTFSSVGATTCSHKGSGCALFYSPKHKNRPTVFIGGSNDTSFDNCAEVLDYTMNNSTWEKRKYSSYTLSAYKCHSGMNWPFYDRLWSLFWQLQWAPENSEFAPSLRTLRLDIVLL